MASYVDSSQAAAATVAVPTGYRAGDIMVAWGVDIENPPDGTWTQRLDVGGLGIFIRVWTKTATSSEGSDYTFLNAGATPNLTVACVRDAVEVPSDIDEASGVSASADADSVDMGAGGGLLLTFFGASTSTLDGTPTGMTQRENTGPNLIELWTESVSAGATGTRSISLSGAGFWLTMPVAIRTSLVVAATAGATAAAIVSGRGNITAGASAGATLGATLTGPAALVANLNAGASLVAILQGLELEVAAACGATLGASITGPGELEAGLAASAALAALGTAVVPLLVSCAASASLASDIEGSTDLTAALACGASLAAVFAQAPITAALSATCTLSAVLANPGTSSEVFWPPPETWRPDPTLSPAYYWPDDVDRPENLDVRRPE